MLPMYCARNCDLDSAHRLHTTGYTCWHWRSCAVMCSHVRPVHWQSCAVICVLCTGSRVQSYASCAPAVICRHLVQLPLSHLVKLPLEACHAFGFAVSIQGCAIKSPTHAIPPHDPRFTSAPSAPTGQPWRAGPGRSRLPAPPPLGKQPRAPGPVPPPPAARPLEVISFR